MDRASPAQIICPFCGRVHRAIPLRFGERALCVDCATPLPLDHRRRNAALAFTITAFIFAVPALQLPLVTVRKLGAQHQSYLWTGVRALWREGMPLLSVWVALCGIAVPLALLSTLAMLMTAKKQEDSSRTQQIWTRVAQAFQHWAMPEVQVLAVLVAFVKIGALVNVQPGAGLWFYGAMTFAMLLAWHNSNVEWQT
jgi:paraquat-inducible protein A